MSPQHERKPLRTNIKPPYWRISGDSSGLRQAFSLATREKLYKCVLPITNGSILWHSMYSFSYSLEMLHKDQVFPFVNFTEKIKFFPKTVLVRQRPMLGNSSTLFFKRMSYEPPRFNMWPEGHMHPARWGVSVWPTNWLAGQSQIVLMSPTNLWRCVFGTFSCAMSKILAHQLNYVRHFWCKHW